MKCLNRTICRAHDFRNTYCKRFMKFKHVNVCHCQASSFQNFGSSICWPKRKRSQELHSDPSGQGKPYWLRKAAAPQKNVPARITIIKRHPFFSFGRNKQNSSLFQVAGRILILSTSDLKTLNREHNTSIVTNIFSLAGDIRSCAAKKWKQNVCCKLEMREKNKKLHKQSNFKIQEDFTPFLTSCGDLYL